MWHKCKKQGKTLPFWIITRLRSLRLDDLMIPVLNPLWKRTLCVSFSHEKGFEWIFFFPQNFCLTIALLFTNTELWKSLKKTFNVSFSLERKSERIRELFCFLLACKNVHLYSVHIFLHIPVVHITQKQM